MQADNNNHLNSTEWFPGFIRGDDYDGISLGPPGPATGRLAVRWLRGSPGRVIAGELRKLADMLEEADRV